MANDKKEMKQISCRDFGKDCDFLVRAESEEEVLKVAGDHGCRFHGFCDVSDEQRKEIQSRIKTVYL